MPGNYRTVAGSRRKPKKNIGLIVLAGIIVTSLVVVAIAAATYVLGSSSEPSDAVNSSPTRTGPEESGAIKTNSPQANSPQTNSPQTNSLQAKSPQAKSPQGGGPPMTLTSADGFEYSVIALDGKVANGTAFIDYVLTNTSDREALLEKPGDLFITKSLVSEPNRCIPRPGADPTMCSMPNTTKIVGMIGTSKPPVTRNGDKFMPARAAYRLRITSDIAIDTKATRRNLHLYVWNARFIGDRRAHLVALP